MVLENKIKKRGAKRFLTDNFILIERYRLALKRLVRKFESGRHAKGSMRSFCIHDREMSFEVFGKRSSPCYTFINSSPTANRFLNIYLNFILFTKLPTSSPCTNAMSAEGL